MTVLSAHDFGNMYEQKGGKIVKRKVPRSGRVKVDPDKVLSEEQILQALNIDSSEAIFIRGEVPSSKNSKRIFTRHASRSNWKHYGRTVVPFITDSEATTKYKKNKKGEYAERVMDWKRIIAGKKTPLYVEFIFLRSTKQKWDYNNLTECPQDLMQECGWIDDDDTTIMFPFPPPPPGFLIDKNNAGVIIKLSNIYDNNKASLKFRIKD